METPCKVYIEQNLRMVSILGKLKSSLTSSSMKTICYSLVNPHIYMVSYFGTLLRKPSLIRFSLLRKKIFRIITRSNNVFRVTRNTLYSNFVFAFNLSIKINSSMNIHANRVYFARQIVRWYDQ